MKEAIQSLPMMAKKDPQPFRMYSAVALEDMDKVKLPVQVEMTYGCENCEWKELEECPYGYTGKQQHKDFICPERILYLKGFYKGEVSRKKKITVTEWESDFDQAIARKLMQFDYENVLKIKKKIEELREKEAPLEEISIMEKKAERIREQWRVLWKDLRKFQEQRLDREAPKKLEVEHKGKISVSDFQRMINEDMDYEEADYEVMDDN